MNLALYELMDIIKNLCKWPGIGIQEIPFLLREIITEAIIELKSMHKSGNYMQLLVNRLTTIRENK